MTLAKAFRKLRLSLGLTQTEMAWKLKMWQGSLSALERGRYRPSAEVLIQALRLDQDERILYRYVYGTNHYYTFFIENKNQPLPASPKLG